MVLAVVTVFLPDLKELSASIASYVDSVDRILLWRNSPVTFDHPKVELCGDGTNQGISAALNYAWHYAQEHGYDWILTMDQDTRWIDFKSFLDEVTGECAPEGIFVPRMADEPARSGFTEVTELITSGTLQRTETATRLGGWRTDFLVDGIDFDYGMKARLAGISIYKVASGAIDHHLGSPQTRKFLGKSFTTANYSPYRLFEMYRNHWIVIRSYPALSAELKARTLHSYRERLPRIILGEKRPFSKIIAILKGTYAGLTYKIQ